jgi:hypothetical protein
MTTRQFNPRGPAPTWALGEIAQLRREFAAPVGLKPCGTEAAYRRHLRHGEKCDTCREAHNARKRKTDRGPRLPAAHGTASKYNTGCRCEPCSAAQRARNLAWREAVAGLPAAFVPHGLNGYRNYGCRCETCKAAGSVANREYRERRKQREAAAT